MEIQRLTEIARGLEPIDEESVQRSLLALTQSVTTIGDAFRDSMRSTFDGGDLLAFARGDVADLQAPFKDHMREVMRSLTAIPPIEMAIDPGEAFRSNLRHQIALARMGCRCGSLDE